MLSKKKIFLLGNSGVGKTTLFNELKTIYSQQLNFIDDKSFELNVNTFTQLSKHDQQIRMIEALGNRDTQSIKQTTIYDENVISTLIWSRALLLKNYITHKQYMEHLVLVKSYVSKLKNSVIVVLKNDLEVIKSNIQTRNRDIEMLESDFKIIYDTYINIYYQELEELINQMESRNVQFIIFKADKNEQGFNQLMKNLLIQLKVLKN